MICNLSTEAKMEASAHDKEIIYLELIFTLLNKTMKNMIAYQ